MEDVVESCLAPFIFDLKASLALKVAQRKRQDILLGWFAVDYEPNREEIESTRKIPQSGVRGVGWNGSTTAWAASWLPALSRRRICATFSTRKYGYHGALKFAMCQRLRAELMTYGRRKFPLGGRDLEENRLQLLQQPLIKGEYDEDNISPPTFRPPAKRGRGRPTVKERDQEALHYLSQSAEKMMMDGTFWGE